MWLEKGAGVLYSQSALEVLPHHILKLIKKTINVTVVWESDLNYHRLLQIISLFNSKGGSL